MNAIHSLIRRLVRRDAFQQQLDGNRLCDAHHLVNLVARHVNSVSGQSAAKAHVDGVTVIDGRSRHIEHYKVNLHAAQFGGQEE